MSTLLRDILQILAPRICCVCGRRLAQGEVLFCKHCDALLPRTFLERVPDDNSLSRLFLGRIPIERAFSLLRYQHSTRWAHIAMDVKFGGRTEAGIYLGERLAQALDGTDFFRDVDVIIPVPLAPKRQKRRGYNQAALLAQGIARHTGLPVDEKAVKRNHETRPQSRMTTKERIRNVRGAFSLIERPERGERLRLKARQATARLMRHGADATCQPFLPAAERLRGKHILLVDDVMTTGATLVHFAEGILDGIAAYEQRHALPPTVPPAKHYTLWDREYAAQWDSILKARRANLPGTRFSILTLCAARLHRPRIHAEPLRPVLPDPEAVRNGTDKRIHQQWFPLPE